MARKGKKREGAIPFGTGALILGGAGVVSGGIIGGLGGAAVGLGLDLITKLHFSFKS